MNWTKPVEAEYLPYQWNYISKVPDGDLIDILQKDIVETTSFLKSIPQEKLFYRYAADKWTIKEVLQHLIDTERIMSYRALCFARNDRTELPGFEENDYVREGNANDRDFNEMIEELNAVRRSTVHMFNSFNNEILSRRGTANKGTVTVNAVAYVIAGHELHHVAIIQDRYLKEKTEAMEM